MIVAILIGIALAALFVAAVGWGADSRIDFTDPRRREHSLLAHRGEMR